MCLSLFCNIYLVNKSCINTHIYIFFFCLVIYLKIKIVLARLIFLVSKLKEKMRIEKMRIIRYNFWFDYRNKSRKT